MIKKFLLFLLSAAMLYGCLININQVEVLELEQKPAEINLKKIKVSSVTSFLQESTVGKDTKMSPNFENVSIEYYKDNSVRPELKTSINYPSSEIEEIVSLCLAYYMKFDPLLDDYGFPNGLSSIKIFNMSDRDDLIVITGDEFFLWPFCFMFTYKDNKLSLFPDSAPFEDDGAEEIRLLYDEGFPYPIVEIFSYSHKNNGSFGIYRLYGNCLSIITGEGVTGYHHTEWHEKRQNTIFDNIGLEEGEFFDCRYENTHLIPTYEDVNNDGYIDIIISGKFQCEDGDYNVLLSQEVKRTFLYDKEQENFIFNLNASIRSPLEEYWYPDLSNKIQDWIGM